ncbi:precorrin-6Y C5,15-methyltransferase (decarboxylating) subunit CbiT [Anaerovibrio slackiae]|uniref:precorrin-6Y C5,15-methyltransferase (decarboxylating) subunit CbiT n=1 Tax=Anaerovibrio slackiae TaxID=2652309 RepID=UPI003F179E4C
MSGKWGIGIPDAEFIRGKVPMTKQEIRILTIAKAGIKQGDIVLDVGAGTGSLSCEAAMQAGNDGMVYAIERNPEGIGLIAANAEKFGLDNVHIIHAEAPAGMDGLPRLDAVLIGGSGKRLEPILDRAGELLKTGGRIILNCITVQTLMQCLNYMRASELYKYETVQVQVNRWEQVGSYDMAKAANPIFIVACEKIK